MRPLFVRVGDCTYNADTIRWFRYSTEKATAQICVGIDPKTKSEIFLFVDDATVKLLLGQLAKRDALIDLTPPGSPGVDERKNQPK